LNAALIGPIEWGIEMPGRPLSYLSRHLKALDVGQSFVVRSEDLKEAARAAARRMGIKIETAKDEGGWRIKRYA
jgi:hypothetical protein